MKANTDSQNIAKKHIKILIKSVQDSNGYHYDLYLCPSHIMCEIFYISFHVLCNQFCITSCNGYAREVYYNIRESNVEFELTRAFCIYANRNMPMCNFDVGSSDECIIELSLLKRQIVSKLKQSVCFENLFIKSEMIHENYTEKLAYDYKTRTQAREHELLASLRNSIDWNDKIQLKAFKRWQFKGFTFDYIFQEQYRKYQLLNIYRYSLAVHEMVKMKTIELDEFVPILKKHDIVDRYTAEDNDEFLKLFWAEPSSLFEKDIYPLELAYMAKNSKFMFYLLKNGATKFSRRVSMDGSSIQSDFISFMFENIKNASEFEITMTFMNNHLKQIEKETQIITESKDYLYSSSFITRINSSGGVKIIISWYKCALRLQSIEYMDLLLRKYKKQILGLLNIMNPYTGNWRDMEEELPSIDMNLEINKYIQKNIIPIIKHYEFKHTSYKDNGIWGYDARTGNPILESDLFVN